MNLSASRFVGFSVLIFVTQLAGCPGRVESLVQTNNEQPGASGPSDGNPVVNDPIVVPDPARVVNMGTNIADAKRNRYGERGLETTRSGECAAPGSPPGRPKRPLP